MKNAKNGFVWFTDGAMQVLAYSVLDPGKSSSFRWRSTLQDLKPSYLPSWLTSRLVCECGYFYSGVVELAKTDLDLWLQLHQAVWRLLIHLLTCGTYGVLWNSNMFCKSAHFILNEEDRAHCKVGRGFCGG